MQVRIVEHEAWPARAAMLAALGAGLGLLFYLLLHESGGRWSEDPVRTSAAALVVVGGIVFAFTLERLRPLWSVLFGLGCGVVVALSFYWNGSPGGWSAGDGWRLFSAVLAVAVAAPLFQAARDAGRRDFAYRAVHAHAWTNLVLWFAAWAFVAATWLMAQLLAELFHLIGLDLLREALRKEWVSTMLLGGALGGAIGLLRDRDSVLMLLQRVATTVLGVLAPALAVGLVLFVAALPFTGLAPLWDKTSSTTPILLLAVAGSFLLANAVVGNAPEEEARAPVLRWSAAALAAVMAPLAAIAAVSTWLRIDQHGFTPERLWAAMFVLVTLCVAVTYLVVLLRARSRWTAAVRPANVRLAISVCLLALVLATPLLNFGAISTRDQVERLTSGAVPPAEFDWAALRFDFGPAGRRALERLGRTGSPEVRRLAARALAADQRWGLAEEMTVNRRAAALRGNVRVFPRPVPLPDDLRQALARGSACASEDCTLFWQPGATEAIAVGFGCRECLASVTRLQRGPKGQWQALAVETTPIPGAATGRFDEIAEQQRRAVAAGRIELREVVRRQVYVDGEPVAGPF